MGLAIETCNLAGTSVVVAAFAFGLVSKLGMLGCGVQIGWLYRPFNRRSDFRFVPSMHAVSIWCNALGWKNRTWEKPIGRIFG